MKTGLKFFRYSKNFCILESILLKRKANCPNYLTTRGVLEKKARMLDALQARPILVHPITT
jgi:hypothetical protein